MMTSKNAAAARRDEIIAENINFMYGRSKEIAAADSDKRSFVKSNKFIDPFDTISDFSGQKSFLLPSYNCEVFLNGEPDAYPSYEHALQASRFALLEERNTIRLTPLIRDVKKMTPKFTSNKGELWKQECLSTAERLLRDKFIRSKQLTLLLKETGKKSLVYSNSYGDHFWGTPLENFSKGSNYLGKLLEKIRNDIIRGEDVDLWLTSHIIIIEQAKVNISLKVLKNGEEVTDDCQVFERRPKLFLGKADLNDVVTAHTSTSRTHAAVVVGNLSSTTTKDSSITVGASSRTYRFVVDSERDQKKKEELYSKLSNPDILATKAEEQNQENTIFAGNISFEATEKDIREFFEICGDIQALIIPTDKDKPGVHKGIAFITFTTSSGLVQALSRGGDELLGRNISVKRRLPKPNSNAPVGSLKLKSKDFNKGTEKEKGKERELSDSQHSYYTNQRDTNHGSLREREGENSLSSLPKSRFSATSSSSAPPSSSDVTSYGSDATNGLIYGKNDYTETDINSSSTHKIKGTVFQDEDIGNKKQRGEDANAGPSSRDRREELVGDNDLNRKRVRSCSESPAGSSRRRNINIEDRDRDRDRDRGRRNDNSPDKGMRAGSHLDDGNTGKKSAVGARRDRSNDRGRDRRRERSSDRSSDRGRDRSNDRRRDMSRDRGRDRSNDRGRGRSRDRRRERSRERGSDRRRDRSIEKDGEGRRERSSDIGRDRGRDRSRERRRDHKDGLRTEDWDRNMNRGRDGGRCTDSDLQQHELSDGDTNIMKSRSKTEKLEVVGDKSKTVVQRTVEDKSDNESSSSSSSSGSGDSGSGSDSD